MTPEERIQKLEEIIDAVIDGLHESVVTDNSAQISEESFAGLSHGLANLAETRDRLRPGNTLTRDASNVRRRLTDDV